MNFRRTINIVSLRSKYRIHMSTQIERLIKVLSRFLAKNRIQIRYSSVKDMLFLSSI